MRRLRRHDQDLMCFQLDDVFAGGPAAAPLEEDERLRVGVHVQVHTLAGRRPNDEHGNADGNTGDQPLLVVSVHESGELQQTFLGRERPSGTAADDR